MIRGKVDSGRGQARRIPEDMFQARCRAAGTELARGTLNLRTENLEQALIHLGRPDFETDGPENPLRWWRVELLTEAEGHPVAAGKTFAVRHYRTQTGYLEIMSEVHLRTELNIDDGSIIQLRKYADRS